MYIFCQMLGILDDISKWSSRLHRYTLCGRMEMWNIGGKSLNDAKKNLTKKWTELQFSSTYLIRHYYLDGICIVAFRYLLHFCIKWVLRSYVILQKPPAIMHSVLKIQKIKKSLALKTWYGFLKFFQQEESLWDICKTTYINALFLLLC